MSNVELPRALFTGRNRLKYYINVDWFMWNKRYRSTVKLDTGAIRTILSLREEPFLSIQSNIKKTAELCSNKFKLADGTCFDAYRLHVDKCVFGKDSAIALTNFEVHFSDVPDKHLLGCDILTLFNFIYKRNYPGHSGTYNILNVEEGLKYYNEWKDASTIENLEAYDVDSIVELAPSSWKDKGMTSGQIVELLVTKYPEYLDKYRKHD